MNQTSQTVQTKHVYIEYKKYFYILLTAILITDLTILLNIPYLRQIFGFLFLTLLPGLLILQILKLNKIDFLEKFILIWGLSISFIIFFGLLINNLLFRFGYKTPLATIPILILFNIAFIILVVIGYTVSKEPIFSQPNLDLSTAEKAFLIVPILFPALSIFGMHVMNITDNNIILMFLLFLIPIYVVFVCIFNQKFSKRLYPVVIFLISISLLLLYALRSNHIIGTDTHFEYYLFRITLDNLHWRVLSLGNPLDACLAISILPTIYQSILNINPEFLFKILYSLIYSISPLVIYVISKKYVGESYGFLASCFFMFQLNFFETTANSRTCIAILFFMLAMMTLFSDKIDPLKKRIFFIIFMASCMVSHYSTTYIFFFIMLGAFVGVEILSKKYTVKKVISLTLVVLFFALIFFWYSQVTETAFNAGVGFIENTFIDLNKFFVEESRTKEIGTLAGKDFGQVNIPNKIEFVFTWLTFMLIGIGVITLIRRYKEMSFPELNFKKADFLKDKFEVEYFVIALACVGLLVVVVVLPFISLHYGLSRVYGIAITILSVFFVIGGIILSKHFFFLKKKTCAKRKSIDQTASYNSFRKSGDEENASRVRAYLIILLVLIPYFLCVTSVMDQMLGYSPQIILSSEGKMHDQFFVYDQESYGAKWLKGYVEEGDLRVYADVNGAVTLSSQGLISFYTNAINPISEPKDVTGYVFLGYVNVVKGKIYVESEFHDIAEYSTIFVEKNKIYANGGSEVYR